MVIALWTSTVLLVTCVYVYVDHLISYFFCVPVDFKFVIRTEISFNMLVINVHTSSHLNQFEIIQQWNFLQQEWKIGPTVLTLCEHLFVSFAIRALRKQANKYVANIKWKRESDDDNQKALILAKPKADKNRLKFIWKWGIGKFVFSGIVAYVDGRLCRCIPNPVARRIVSGFLLSFLDNNSKE